MTTKKIKLLLAVLTLFSLPMTAQEKKLFTLEDLNYGGTNFRNMQPQNQWLTWWGDELVRTDLEECWQVDKRTGREKRLFTLEDINEVLKREGESRMVRHIASVEFPYAGEPILAVASRQGLTLVDFKQKTVVWQDSVSGQEARDWNAQSRATAYVKDHQLYVVDAEGKTTQLSTDGSQDIVYGKSVHRDEFGINKGTFWSPDGQRLAFYRMDQREVTDYPQVDIYNREATYEPDKYPMAGETSHKVTVGVYDLGSDKTVYLQAGDPTDRYFTNIAWSPDSKTIYMFELNRDQNDCRLTSYDAVTGLPLGELYRETNEKYVEPLHAIQFLPWDADRFIMQSQRDGYNHLYIYNKAGELQQQLTQGAWVVEEVLGFDTKRKRILITSNELNPIQRNTWSVDVKTGQRTLLDNGEGSHRAVASTSGQWLYDKWSTPEVPRCIDVVETGAKRANSTAAKGWKSGGRAVRLLTSSDPWAEYEQPLFESGTLKAADGVTDLYYRMVKPANFNAEEKYPTVVYVYGGPHAHNVEASWHWASRSWETYMAQKGYVLFILDNRGSENRGREFEQATFRQLGQVEMLDQMRGVEFLKSLPYVDADRLGVHGWSFGGFMTISLMTTYPEVFKVGVAGGPVIDWKWYEVMYGERYMDTPQQNPEGYARTSLINKAQNLRGRLQIITGYNDATVVPQHCLSFLDACIKAGTQPDFFVYPGEPHNMRGHASVHLHERITQYFEDYLKGSGHGEK